MAGRLKYFLWLVALAMLMPFLAGAAAAHVHTKKGVPHDMGSGSARYDSVQHESAGHSIAHVPCHPSANSASNHRADRAAPPSSHHRHDQPHSIAPRDTTHEPGGKDAAQGTSVRASPPFHACVNCWLDCKCTGGCVSVSASFGLDADGGALDFAGFGEAFSLLSADTLHSWLTRPSPPPPRI